MNTLADVFNTDLFSTTSLTASINKQPVPPSVIGDLKIFSEAGIETTSVVIESQGGTLTLVPNKPRGAPGTPFKDSKRSGITLTVPHLPAVDHLTPDQVQNVRQFGTPNQLLSIQAKRDEKLANMSRSLDYTLEYHRLGAVQGVILDADGTVIYDLFNQFNVAAPADVDFTLDVAYDPTAQGPIETKLFSVKNTIRTALLNQQPTGLLALCGDTFFQKLTAHPEVRATYLNQAAANDLRQTDVQDKFFYRGCTFIHYPGYGNVAIAANDCRFVPLGVPDLFITRFAPAPYFSAVNTTGLPKYTLATLDPSGEKYIELEAQSNPINVCTRPEVLIKGTV
jgi:hypothetical protein